MANSRISFTAHYTAQTWRQFGFDGAQQFDTLLGRAMYQGVRLGKLPLRALLAPQHADFERFLAARHRSFGAEIERLQPDCLIEIACGLSARGLHAARLDPALQVYEYDLPGMVDYKRKRLAHNVPANYHLSAGNLLTGEGLTPPAGGGRRVIVTEGLISYLTPAQKHQAWKQVQRLMSESDQAHYLFEEWPRERLGRGIGKLASGMLGLLTGGNMGQQLFATEGDLLRATSEAGFGAVIPVTPELEGLDPAHCPWLLLRIDR